VARYALLTVANLAWFLGADRRRAYARVARLEERGLVGRRPLAAGAPALWATDDGLRLIAAVAGLSPAHYRRQTATAGGAPDRPGARRATAPGRRPERGRAGAAGVRYRGGSRRSP
jgi:hypothetical protein